jgi:hypothetical protein
VNLPTYPHEAFLEICFIGVMPNFIVHSIQTENEQRHADFVFAVQSKQKEIIRWQSGWGALFQVCWYQALHDVAYNEVFYTVLCGRAVTKYTAGLPLIPGGSVKTIEVPPQVCDVNTRRNPGAEPQKVRACTSR